MKIVEVIFDAGVDHLSCLTFTASWENELKSYKHRWTKRKGRSFERNNDRVNMRAYREEYIIHVKIQCLEAILG